MLQVAVIPCQLFARDMVFPERLTTSGKIGTIRYVVFPERLTTSGKIGTIRYVVFPERLTTSGKIGTIRKGSMDYQISLEDVILSSTRR